MLKKTNFFNILNSFVKHHSNNSNDNIHFPCITQIQKPLPPLADISACWDRGYVLL